jgi:hypothetical protein
MRDNSAAHATSFPISRLAAESVILQVEAGVYSLPSLSGDERNASGDSLIWLIACAFAQAIYPSSPESSTSPARRATSSNTRPGDHFGKLRFQRKINGFLTCRPVRHRDFDQPAFLIVVSAFVQ